MGLGIAYGQGAPAQSIMSTNSIWMTMYTVSLDGAKLSNLELIGLTCGILGAFIISTGDMILDKFFKKSLAEEEKVPKKIEMTKVDEEGPEVV